MGKDFFMDLGALGIIITLIVVCLISNYMWYIHSQKLIEACNEHYGYIYDALVKCNPKTTETFINFNDYNITLVGGSSNK